MEMVAATAQIESRRALLWICRIYRALLRGSLSHVGLFCGYVGYVELFCEYVGLFCRAIGLFCGIVWRARAVEVEAAKAQIELWRAFLWICKICRALWWRHRALLRNRAEGESGRDGGSDSSY